MQAQSAPDGDAGLPHGRIQYLWPNGATGALGTEEQDRPHLEVFPGYGPTPRAGVIVCPGGGYVSLAYENEGIRIAEWLNLRGITAFVLRYRLSPRYQYPMPLVDGYRAVRWVRGHAREYDVASDRIGMWGFSAGGHLAGMVATHFDRGNPQAADPIERVSDRPDFVISSYGVLAMTADVVNSGAFKTLLGDHVSQQFLDEVSPDKHVTAQTPPFFLFSTTVDRLTVVGTVDFYAALVKAGVPAEMHVFETGEHGAGLGQANPELAEWPTLLENWLRLHGWIASPQAH